MAVDKKLGYDEKPAVQSTTAQSDVRFAESEIKNQIGNVLGKPLPDFTIVFDNIFLEGQIAQSNNPSKTDGRVGSGSDFSEFTISYLNADKTNSDKVMEELKEFFTVFSNYKLRRFHPNGKLKELQQTLKTKGEKLAFFSENISMLIPLLLQILNTPEGKKYLGKFTSFFSISSISEIRTYDPDLISILSSSDKIPIQFNDEVYGYEAIIEFDILDYDFRKQILAKLGIILPEVRGTGESMFIRGDNMNYLPEDLFSNIFPIHENIVLEISSRATSLKSIDLCIKHLENSLNGFDSVILYPSYEFKNAFGFYEAFRVNLIRYLEYYISNLSQNVDMVNLSKYCDILGLKLDFIDKNLQELFRKFIFHRTSNELKNLGIILPDFFTKKEEYSKLFLNTSGILKAKFDDFSLLDSFLIDIGRINLSNKDISKEVSLLEELIGKYLTNLSLEKNDKGELINNSFYSCLNQQQQSIFKKIFFSRFDINQGIEMSIFGLLSSALKVLERFSYKLRNNQIEDNDMEEIETIKEAILKAKDVLKIALKQFIPEFVATFNQEDKKKIDFLLSIVHSQELSKKIRLFSDNELDLKKDDILKFILYFFVKNLEKKAISFSEIMKNKELFKRSFSRSLDIIRFKIFNTIPNPGFASMGEIEKFFDKYDKTSVSQDEIDENKEMLGSAILSMGYLEAKISGLFNELGRKEDSVRDIYDIGVNIAHERTQILEQKSIRFRYFQTEYTESDGIVYCEEYDNNRLIKAYLIRYDPIIFKKHYK